MSATRWRLHRGGVVNIWQYAEHTFDLSGGRAIFQGTNGSGKSRTLELLLPLCLDGDLRQLGSKGFDSVSMRRLMLDEYPGGPNRVGYTWVELRRDAEYLTCGIGVKASRTSHAITDSWRFLTSRRVGHDLHLVGPDRVPLGPAQLRDLLGADSLLEEHEFRARVAELVYGMPAARYGDLLHLQRTLRNPDVGLKVLEGQLEQILSDALPPLDPALVERLATSFEDLESIRENILRLSTADRAFGEFLSTYSGYAFGALRNRAESMRGARSKLRSLRDELTSLDEQVAVKRQECEAAQQNIAEREKREAELESSIDTLRSHPAYAELSSLRDRERLVDGARSAAVAALDTASRHRAQEERSLESVLGVLRRLGGDGDAAQRCADQAAARLSAAGLDGSLVPRVPPAPSAEVPVSQEPVRTAPEPSADPVAVDRRMPPPVDVDQLEDAFGAAVDQCEHASSAAQQRGALALALHQQAAELDTQRDKVSDLQRQARQAQLTATDTAGRRNQAHQELSVAAAAWSESAKAWKESTVDDFPEPPPVEDLLADRSSTRRFREQARQAARPLLRQAQQHFNDLERQCGSLEARCHEHADELARLRAGQERIPARPEWAEAPPASSFQGTPFYRLVDFQPLLSESERAGLEGALQASGLLNAWVTADGRLPEDVSDVFARPGPAASHGSLAELLVPAVEPGCPIPPDQIAALLESVPTDGHAELALSSSGRWRSGVLTGRWRKQTAEFVGAGAREAARARGIAELEQELSDLRAEADGMQQRRQQAAEHAATLERSVEDCPDDGELLAAHAKLTSAVEAAEDAERMAAQWREQYEHADQRWQAAHSDLARSAAHADLAAETAALDTAQRVAADARTAIEGLREVIRSRCLPTLAELQHLMLHHDAAIADRMEAESQAEKRAAEYGETAAGMAELTTAAGEEATRIADQVSWLEQERFELREALPQARESLSTLRETAVRLETQRDSKRGQLEFRETEAADAESAFDHALRTAGFWAAAGESEVDAPADPDEAAELLLSQERRAFGETAALNRLQGLQQSLSGSYDITAEQVNGLLTVTVTGEDGPRPVADAAHRVRARLAEQRGYLNERYQSIFASYLIRDLADRLRAQISIAEDLCQRMNEVLDGTRSSQGVHVQLEWQPAPALDDGIRTAIELVRTPFSDRTEEQDALLRRVFTELIESERESAAGGYAEILARALDYRTWFTFTVRVRDADPDGKPRVRRLKQLSSGETRLVSYVTLFAAAAAFYDAVSVSAGDRAPLRLVLLDEAFERLDDPTIARMLALLVDLDMDWLITWPSGWGVSPKIPTMHIYDILRPRSGHGIACTHTTWNGDTLQRRD